MDRNRPVLVHVVLCCPWPVYSPKDPHHSLPCCSHSEAPLQLFQAGGSQPFCLIRPSRDLSPREEQPFFVRQFFWSNIIIGDSSVYGLHAFSFILYLLEKDIIHLLSPTKYSLCSLRLFIKSPSGLLFFEIKTSISVLNI